MKKKVEVLFKNPRMEKKRQQGQRLQRVLERLRKDGMTLEQIAVDLHVCMITVYKWLTGRRVPKYPTLRFIESKYKVKLT